MEILDWYLDKLHYLYIKAKRYNIPTSIQRMISDELRDFVNDVAKPQLALPYRVYLVDCDEELEGSEE